MVPSFSYYVMCPIFFHPYKLVCIYIYVILRTCTIYTIRTCIHYYKDSLGSLSLLASKIFPFSSRLFLTLSRSFTRTKEEQNVKEGVGFCAILESTRHSPSASRLYVWKITLFVTSF